MQVYWANNPTRRKRSRRRKPSITRHMIFSSSSRHAFLTQRAAPPPIMPSSSLWRLPSSARRATSNLSSHVYALCHHANTSRLFIHAAAYHNRAPFDAARCAGPLLASTPRTSQRDSVTTTLPLKWQRVPTRTSGAMGFDFDQYLIRPYPNHDDTVRHHFMHFLERICA